MTWKIIKDFPNYRIDKQGNIQSCYKFKTNIPCDTWRDVKQIYDKSCGYMIVTLCHEGVRKNKRVHRLLMEAFVPNPNTNKYVHINHKDANKLNNSLDNLEWVTSKQNAQHALQMGLYQPTFDALSVAIDQYDKQGNFIQQHKSIHEAGRATNTQWQNIWKVCNNHRKTAGNFIWRYANARDYGR